MGKALDISRAVFSPGKELLGLVIKAANRPEIIQSLAGLLKKHGTKTMYIHAISAGEDLELMVYLDISKAKVKVEEIVKDVASAKGVKDASSFKPLFNGFIIDVVHFPVLALGSRAWIARESVLNGIFRDIKVALGDAGKVFLYYQGKKVGEDVYEDYRKIASSKKEILALFSALVRATGWGIIEEISFNSLEGMYTIKISDSIECTMSKPSKEPSGYFFKGVLAGLLTKIENRDVIVEEVKCIAKGDEYCMFIARISK